MRRHVSKAAYQSPASVALRTWSIRVSLASRHGTCGAAAAPLRLAIDRLSTTEPRAKRDLHCTALHCTARHCSTKHCRGQRETYRTARAGDRSESAERRAPRVENTAARTECGGVEKQSRVEKRKEEGSMERKVAAPGPVEGPWRLPVDVLGLLLPLLLSTRALH